MFSRCSNLVPWKENKQLSAFGLKQPCARCWETSNLVLCPQATLCLGSAARTCHSAICICLSAHESSWTWKRSPLGLTRTEKGDKSKPLGRSDPSLVCEKLMNVSSRSWQKRFATTSVANNVNSTNCVLPVSDNLQPNQATRECQHRAGTWSYWRSRPRQKRLWWRRRDQHLLSVHCQCPQREFPEFLDSFPWQKQTFSTIKHTPTLLSTSSVVAVGRAKRPTFQKATGSISRSHENVVSA